MDSISINLFYVPSIALTLVIIFYFYHIRKVERKQTFVLFFWRIAFFAYLFNLIWEIGQGFLYEGYVYDFPHISFCALASIADVFMVILLYFGFSLIYRNIYWAQRLNFLKAFILVFTGGAGAIFSEAKHLSAGHWAYADTMPLLPIADVGLSPVLQFMILPILIYWLSFRVTNNIFIINSK